LCDIGLTSVTRRNAKRIHVTIYKEEKTNASNIMTGAQGVKLLLSLVPLTFVFCVLYLRSIAAPGVYHEEIVLCCLQGQLEI